MVPVILEPDRLNLMMCNNVKIEAHRMTRISRSCTQHYRKRPQFQCQALDARGLGLCDQGKYFKSL